MNVSSLACLVKGHSFHIVDIECKGIPYMGTDRFEFVDYEVFGECRRCGKRIKDYGRVRVAYWLKPTGPILASTPLWIADSRENRKAIKNAVKEYVKKRQT